MFDTTIRKQTEITWSLLLTTGGKDEPNIGFTNKQIICPEI
jgi:hypothetical protein